MKFYSALTPFTFFSTLLLLAGCGVIKPPTEQITQSPEAIEESTNKRLGDDEILSRISALPGQTLEDSTCGLFLWLRRDDAPLIFFQRSNDPSATMILDGVSQSLPRISATELIGFNFFENQTFENNAFKLSVKTKAEAVRSIRQGIKIETGSISMTTNNGWSAALPVAGVVGCK
ncbi:hypothetical protein [Kordiimonas aquimaris]|uniref:hypothetical protein n=1 Tax=Kordiimonas aquimaris TaxID=707591 RepID=UPI0021D11011|nr:hypothetical protein [Kordiimonas aquimaris]